MGWWKWENQVVAVEEVDKITAEANCVFHIQASNRSSGFLWAKQDDRLPPKMAVVNFPCPQQNSLFLHHITRSQ